MIATWVQDAVKNWEVDKTNLSNGASKESIYTLEELLGVKLPADFIEFYLIMDGFRNLDLNKNLYSIWPIERIKNVYLNSNNKNFIAFCDYLMDSHLIGYSKPAEGIFNDFDLEKPIVLSFREFIKFINKN